MVHTTVYMYLSSTLREIDPDAAYVVCISVSLGFLLWYPYSLAFLIWYPYAHTSLYGYTGHCPGYGVAMGCYGLFNVTRTVIVTSQWYDRYCFMEYARTWARHPKTPWQRECTAITDYQSIHSLLDSMRFVTDFWEITPYILRDAIVVSVQSLCYSINARAFGPRTPYGVGGLGGGVMCAWVSHYLVNHWIYNFKASLLSCKQYICTVVRPASADFHRDVCLTVSRNHALFLLYNVPHWQFSCHFCLHRIYAYIGEMKIACPRKCINQKSPVRWNQSNHFGED